jgi:hypothetical protein
MGKCFYNKLQFQSAILPNSNQNIDIQSLSPIQYQTNISQSLNQNNNTKFLPPILNSNQNNNSQSLTPVQHQTNISQSLNQNNNTKFSLPILNSNINIQATNSQQSIDNTLSIPMNQIESTSNSKALLYEISSTTDGYTFHFVHFIFLKKIFNDNNIDSFELLSKKRKEVYSGIIKAFSGDQLKVFQSIFNMNKMPSINDENTFTFKALKCNCGEYAYHACPKRCGVRFCQLCFESQEPVALKSTLATGCCFNCCQIYKNDGKCTGCDKKSKEIVCDNCSKTQMIIKNK